MNQDSEYSYLERLPQLHKLLQEANLAHSIDCWLSVEDLLFKLRQEQRLPTDPIKLLPLLGPIFCRSGDDQIQFRQLYSQWLQGFSSGVQNKEPSAPLLQSSDKPVEGDAGEKLPSSASEPPPRPKLWPVASVVLGALLLMAVAVNFQSIRDLFDGVIEVAVPDAVPKIARTIEGVPDTGEPEPDQVIIEKKAWQELPLEEIPARLPLEAPSLDESYNFRLQAAGWLAGLPLVGFVIWLLWFWLRRNAVLRHGSGDPNDPLRFLRVQLPRDDIFNGADLRRALKKLHTPHAHPTRRLNAAATVDKTLRQARLFQPVYWDRAEVPELVVLVEYQHSADHMAGLSGLVIQRLQDAGLSVHRYDYRVEPRYLYVSGSQRVESIISVAAKHQGAHLLLLGDPAALVNVWSGELKSWSSAFRAWPHKGVLNTRVGAQAWQTVLQRSGFFVGAFNSSGLTALSNSLGQTVAAEESVAGGKRLPKLLRNSDVWMRPVKPEEKKEQELLRVLYRYVGGSGFYLLGAMSVYPELNWGLTRAVDFGLFPDEGGSEARELRLLRLAQLPWCRQGWFPDWLRQSFIDELSPYQKERIHVLYLELFRKQKNAPEGGIRLPITLPSVKRHWLRFLNRQDRNWQAYLKDLVLFRSPESVFNDRVFVSFLWGRGKALDFRLPSSVSDFWPLLLRRLLPLGLLVGLAVFGLFKSWAFWGEALLSRTLLASQQGQYAEIPVMIRTTAEAKVLAEALQQTLFSHGFEGVVLGREWLNGKGRNRIRLGGGVNDEVGNYIAARLAYLKYRGSENIFFPSKDRDLSDEGEVVIELRNPPLADRLIFVRDELKSKGLSQSQEEKFSDPQNFSTLIKVLKVKAPRMVVIPAGSFQMGCVSDKNCRDREKPVHQVTIANSFALSQTEVTFADYDRFAKATKRKLPDDEGWGRGNRPVINVTWNDAKAYAKWLSGQTGEKYRLPTEAEWEYAARAGTKTPFSTGDCIGTDQANYNGNSSLDGCKKSGLGRGKTLAVGSFQANAFGLQDMHGNVWEWTEDCWHDDYRGSIPLDGLAWLEKKCEKWVIRGGSWLGSAEYVRSAHRNRRNVTKKGSYAIGFRLVRYLKVDFRPLDFTVYVQYSSGSKVLALKVQKILKQEGYRVPGIEKINDVPSNLQVRYYYREHKHFADKLARKLEKNLDLPVESASAILFIQPNKLKKLPKGILEVWIPR